MKQSVRSYDRRTERVPVSGHVLRLLSLRSHQMRANGYVVEWSTKGCLFLKSLVEWGFCGERTQMKKQPRTRRLGAFLRDRRVELKLSIREVARTAHVENSTILRLERGEYAAPSANKLARIAEVLTLNLADVFAMAGYVVPSSLPNFPNYLRLRYPELTEEAIAKLDREFEITIAPLRSEHPVEAEARRLIEQEARAA